VSAQPLNYAVVSGVTAIAATTVASALALSQEVPSAAALGFSFGISFAPHSALVAMPLGVLLSTLRSRMGLLAFMLVALLSAGLLGMLFGWWVVGDGHYFPESMAVYICITWALSAFVVSAFSSPSPDSKDPGV